MTANKYPRLFYLLSSFMMFLLLIVGVQFIRRLNVLEVNDVEKDKLVLELTGNLISNTVGGFVAGIATVSYLVSSEVIAIRPRKYRKKHHKNSR